MDIDFKIMNTMHKIPVLLIQNPTFAVGILLILKIQLLSLPSAVEHLQGC